MICRPRRISAEAIPPALSLGQHGHRAEHLDVDQPTRSIEQAAGEHHVPDDLATILGDQ